MMAFIVYSDNTSDVVTGMVPCPELQHLGTDLGYRSDAVSKARLITSQLAFSVCLYHTARLQAALGRMERNG